MVGWHHQLDGHELEEALGVGDGQGSLACCSPWVAKTGTRLSDWTELGQNVSIVSPSTCHEVMGLDAMILGF